MIFIRLHVEDNFPDVAGKQCISSKKPFNVVGYGWGLFSFFHVETYAPWYNWTIVLGATLTGSLSAQTSCWRLIVS